MLRHRREIRADQVHGLSRAGKPLFVRYALDRNQRRADQRRARVAGAGFVALSRTAAGEACAQHRQPRRMHDTSHPHSRRGFRRNPGERRRSVADRLLQGARYRSRRFDGKGIGALPSRHADQRQRRRCTSRLRQPRGHAHDRVLSGKLRQKSMSARSPRRARKSTASTG